MRTYPFELPLNVPFFYRDRLISKVVDHGLWNVLPVPLVNRMAEAAKTHTGLEITKADLDSIPDDVWARVLTVIG